MIYFVRHGESIGNVEGIIQGSLDLGLTDKGMEQAGYLSKALKNKSKSTRGLLLEIEIDLLELQDKYSRNVISYNSYLAETKRLEKRANKLQ